MVSFFKRVPRGDTDNRLKALGHCSSRQLLDTFKVCSKLDKLLKARIPGSIDISK